jgi:glycosyltransferase involved in cell wall biosynthesis
MNIGVNARHLLENKLEGIGWYSFEILKRIVALRPNDHFFFFYDRKTPPLVKRENITNVIVYPQARHPILFKIWYNFSLSLFFKKYKIDCFFSPDGFLSLSSSIRQIGVIHDLNFEHYPKDLPKHILRYYKKNMPLFAKKASNIVTVSNFSKEDICKKYKVSSKKVKVIYNGGGSNFIPLSAHERKDFINSKNNGRPYFIYVGSLHKRKNIERMLKAFTIFNEKLKKMDFLIIGEPMWQKQLNLDGLLDNVKFLGRKSGKDLSQLVASSSAMVYVSYFEGFGLPVLEGMMAGVPVVTSDKTSIPEVGGQAVIYTDPFSVDSIKNGLIEATSKGRFEHFKTLGLEQSKKFSWESSALEIANLLSN